MTKQSKYSTTTSPAYSFKIRNVGEVVGIAIDTKGMVYVTDAYKGNVFKFTPEGKHLATIGSKGEKPHQLSQPLGICIDSNDIMYVTDLDKHKVVMFTTDGDYLRCVDGMPEPHGVAVDKTGNVYLCYCIHLIQ